MYNTNQLSFEQFMQNINNTNNSTPYQNLDINQMNTFFNQMMNNPMMMNNNNNNMNIQMNPMMNPLMQMMTMNPVLFSNMLSSMMNNQNQNNFNYQNNQKTFKVQNNQNNFNFQNNNDERFINLFFVVGNEYKVVIPTKPSYSLSTVINQFINKTGNTDINYYIFNGQRLNESLNVMEQGLNDASEIYVAKVQNLMGAI